MTTKDTWVFGLSIDEKIEWCLCKAHRAGSSSSWKLSHEDNNRYCGSLPSEGSQYYHNDKLSISLEEGINNFLDENGLRDNAPLVTAIGVSAVGVTDRRKLRLTNIARYDWEKPTQPLIDFRTLLKMFPTAVNETDRINIHNETTAKACAEWRHADRSGGSIFYVMFSQGVNAALISGGHPLYTELHTELGHMWPHLAIPDYNFDENNSGCRIHGICFEGLGSLRRIKSQWGPFSSIDELPLEAQKTIAYYIAQMCYNGVLASSPAEVLLGGYTPTPSLLDYVRRCFHAFNQRDSNEPYINYEALQRHTFIRLARIAPEDAGIAGALELSLRNLINPKGSTSVSFGKYLAVAV